MTSLERHLLAELVDLAGDGERLRAFDHAGRTCHWCAEPIRLHGTKRTLDGSTGELREEHGAYYKACGTRRATRCASCADRYRRDARSIVLCGLEGGRSVPRSAVEHPAIFATLTAPSFGAVHRRRRRGNRPCRAGGAKTCRHGRTTVCQETHGEGDVRLGEPLCPDCYDYERAVLWNALAPELWRRVTIYCKRHLARAAGTTERGLRERCRLSFVKVAEYQRRGVVHLHVVARLDPAGDDVELADGLGPVALAESFVSAVREVAVAYPKGWEGEARFGTQLDVKVLPPGTVRVAGGVAGYLAKYATKSSDDHGALDRRLRSRSDLKRRRLSAHLRRLVETAWRLGGRAALVDLGLRRFAHALGFRGHWLTKSRRWSVTFAELRAERAAWRAAAEADDRWPEDVEAIVETTWAFAGRGWSSDGEELLAATRRKDEATARRERLADHLAERRQLIEVA